MFMASQLFITDPKSAIIEIGEMFFRDSETAIRVYGDSMAPTYPGGCVISIRKSNESFIVPGSVYLVETGYNRYLARLYYSADKTYYRCISDNTSVHQSGSMKGELLYPEFQIPCSEVKGLWHVVGIIRKETI